MIVNLRDDGWEIIYHRAHALLAAQIAGYWNFDCPSYRLYETIAAISHHDDLEKEWEGDHLTQAGAPFDFTLDQNIPVEHYHRHIDEALYRGRWVALLTSMHLCFLSQGQQDGNDEVAQFIHDQHQRQARWREELEVSKDEAVIAYNFMRWCDRLSLILCQRQVPAAGRSLEINIGPDGQEYWIHETGSGDLTIEPWPFNRDSVTVNVDACYLSQLKFESNDALIQALKEAPRQLVFWTLARS